MTLPALIDKQDTFEIVRDQIAAILAVETVSQQALATTAGKDPTLWALKVYVERSNPWEQYQGPESDLTPIINVWFDTASANKSASNMFDYQKNRGVMNIDCVAPGVSKSSGAGHIPGDMSAALNAQRAARLVRNIIMAAEYTYLGLRGVVAGRWPASVSMFQPSGAEHVVVPIVGARITLEVDYNEYSPQIITDVLEGVDAQVKRHPDGQVVALATYNY